MTQKIALIVGITGQDGSYMAELLLEKGYIVHGIMRRSATSNSFNIDHIFNKLNLHYGDITDAMNIHTIISDVKPDEIYNFAAQSHVKISSELQNYTFQTNTIGVLNILQSIKLLDLNCKFYQASTSEQFGNQTDGSILLNENSLRNPISIYAISKLAAEQICNMYRDAYGMFVVNSILMNHESERRGRTFVTQKIANYVSEYQQNCYIKPLELGNLNAKRDWGYAKEYVEAVYLMMQQEKPDNFVISSGETHSVREYVELAFEILDIKIEWKNSGLDEVGMYKDKILVKVNPIYYRAIDIECLIGDSKKAYDILGWKPKMSFKQLVNKMVLAAIERKLIKN